MVARALQRLCDQHPPSLHMPERAVFEPAGVLNILCGLLPTLPPLPPPVDMSSVTVMNVLHSARGVLAMPASFSTVSRWWRGGLGVVWCGVRARCGMACFLKLLCCTKPSNCGRVVCVPSTVCVISSLNKTMCTKNTEFAQREYLVPKSTHPIAKPDLDLPRCGSHHVLP